MFGPKLKSSVVHIALKLGLLTNQEAREADAHLQNGAKSEPELDCLVACGFLDQPEAEAVRLELEQHLEAHVVELAKRKRKALALLTEGRA